MKSRFARIVVALLAVPLAMASLTSCFSAGTDSTVKISSDVPRTPLGEKMVRCIQAEGWEASVNWDGSVVGPEMPTAQLDLWMEASKACADETKFGDLAQLSSAQIRELYRQEVAEYQCLLAQGKSPVEPPSEQLYEDTFRSADQYYAIKGTIATPELMRLCPAPTWFLNLQGLE